MQRTLGPYQILETLGEGGMGVVYRARHSDLDRDVALKLMRSGAGDEPELARRFKREMLGGSRLHHPNLVRILDAGVIKGERFLAMELVAGKTLEELIERQAPFPWPYVLEIASQLFAGLAHLQSLSMVHRDIKPGNVLVCTDGTVKLTDYGLLTWADATQLTAPGNLVGTILFMAPELFQNQPATGASDVWSLGVVMYKMLTARSHVTIEHIGRFLENLANDRIRPPSEINDSVPPFVSELVMGLLDPDWSVREHDAGKIKKVIDSLLTEMPQSQREGGKTSSRDRIRQRAHGVRA